MHCLGIGDAGALESHYLRTYGGAARRQLGAYGDAANRHKIGQPPQLGWFLEDAWEGLKDIGEGIADVATSAWDRAGDVVDAIDKVYVDITPQWFRQGAGVFLGGPYKFAWDAADSVVKGERIDNALLGAVNNQLVVYKAVAPFAQLGMSFIPGIGNGVSAAIGAGLALAEGRGITDAVLEAAKGAMPGGPLAAAAFSSAVNATLAAAKGEDIYLGALQGLRDSLPGGVPAQMAFDAGVALAQGKTLQEAGFLAGRALVPKDPLAQSAYEMTRRVIAGENMAGLKGSTADAMHVATDVNAARVQYALDKLNQGFRAIGVDAFSSDAEKARDKQRAYDKMVTDYTAKAVAAAAAYDKALDKRTDQAALTAYAQAQAELEYGQQMATIRATQLWNAQKAAQAAQAEALAAEDGALVRASGPRASDEASSFSTPVILAVGAGAVAVAAVAYFAMRKPKPRKGRRR